VAVTIIGPYSPKEFSNLSDLNTLINGSSDAARNSPGSEKSVEPVVVLGNVYLVVTT
jgi:hypothetical protein